MKSEWVCILTSTLTHSGMVVTRMNTPTQPDNLFNLLLNTKIQQSANISMKRTVGAIF